MNANIMRRGIKLKTDVPEFRRCCFCVPLRYGILGYGYIKLIMLVLILLYAIFELIRSYKYLNIKVIIGRDIFWLELFLLIVPTLLTAVEIPYTIVFLVGGHQKSFELLRAFYKFSLVSLCVMTGSLLVGAILLLAFDQVTYILFVLHILFTSGYFVIVAYFILLIRSEISKLESTCDINFSNPITEECILGDMNGSQENDLRLN